MDEDIFENFGYFDDDGNQLNPDLIPKPGLCLLCAFDENPDEIVVCNLNRLGQKSDEEFDCAAFEQKR